MKFARLRLHGFKSFCDDAELVMEPGLTGVVGPNGCGKSNLVEALRWAMGESSYKAMRAAGMDDVIFAGSGGRPARNSAEVTLVLDNSDRTAPTALNIADTLEITRRIEREAGSIYRVNGREVRARDVQLLFADASTGAHSPALVRQGQIGELIAARPTQRRVLLEEAAGISGLHSRRHEAELRLTGAEANLERVDDIIAQVESQLETLKRQARLAIRYRTISADIRRTEATLFHIRWVGARFAEKEAEAAQGQLFAALADATHADLQAQTALASAEAALQPARAREAEAGAALARLEHLARLLDDEVKRAAVRRLELESRLAQLGADREREAALRAEAEAELQRLETERASLGRAESAEAENLERTKAEAARRQESERVVEAEVRARRVELAERRARRSEAVRRIAEREARAERLRRDLENVAAEQEELEKQLESEAGVRAAREALAGRRAAAEAAERAALNGEGGTQAAQRALDALRPGLEVAETRMHRLESEAETLKRILGAGGARRWPPIADLIEVEPGYERAVSAAFGDDLEAATDTQAPRHWEEQAPRDEDPALPAGLEPLARHVRGAPELLRRLLQVAVVEPGQAPALLPHLRAGQALVSTGGALWRWDGLVAAADAPGATAERLAQRNRLAEIEVEIGKAAAEREARKAENAAAAARLANARREEQALRAAAREAQRDIAAGQSALDRAQKAVLAVEARAGALLASRRRLESDLEELGRAAATDVLPPESALQPLERALAGEETALVAARQAAEGARLQLAGLEALERQRADRLARIDGETLRWQRRADGATGQLATLVQRSNDLEAELEALATAPERFGDRRSALQVESGIARAAHRAAQATLDVVEATYREAGKVHRDARERLGQAREAAARMEERLKGLGAARAQIERNTVEALGIEARQTLEASGIKASEALPQEGAVESRLERLKAERERLGAVNLTAEREAAEIGEKRDVMVKDRTDLLEAIAKLRVGISTLNREGRSRLSEAFETVNAHFQALFTTLFGGGTAELRFVESDDPLEAGLEIIARPPGKKPTTMTLLSGGEQALTALSLIFAVFLTNPAPICVLDEVDAPLDDANVERFCTLLHSMRQRTDTRFLVITHNPITMSRLDRLYGVTMAEKGVSQLVSVDLGAAEALREAV